jgi:hypothetical protein
MKRLLPVGASLAAALLAGTAAQAQQRVDLELVLLADASGSIDTEEIRFQRQGWAAAITDPEILEAIRVGHDGKIAVTYVEWGTAASQDVVVPWAIIAGPAEAEAFARALLAAPRRAFGSNAIGSALAFAQDLIESNALDGHRKVIDLAGDSANTWSGIPIALARERALAADITINGLALNCPAKPAPDAARPEQPGSPAGPGGCSGRPIGYDLEEAFARTIIGGPASFVITADRETSFAQAARQKLLLEIAGPAPGASPDPRSSPAARTAGPAKERPGWKPGRAARIREARG